MLCGCLFRIHILLYAQRYSLSFVPSSWQNYIPRCNSIKRKKTESSLSFCLDGLRTENVSFFLKCSNDDIELYSRLKQNNIIFHMYLCMQVCCIHSFVIPTRDKEFHTILGISESLWAGAGNLSCTMLNKEQFFIT